MTFNGERTWSKNLSRMKMRSEKKKKDLRSLWKILIQNRNGQIVQVWNAFRNLGRRNLGWRSCPSPGHCFRNDLPGGKRAKKPDTERSANLPQGENVLRVSLFFFFSNILFLSFPSSPGETKRGGSVALSARWLPLLWKWVEIRIRIGRENNV